MKRSSSAGRRFIPCFLGLGAALMLLTMEGNARAAGTRAFQVVTGTASSGAIVIDNPATNHKPGAKLNVTPYFISSPGYNNHPAGVFYTQGRWAIINEDEAPLAANTKFNVRVGSGPATFTASASRHTCAAFFTFLNNPGINKKPNALLLATNVILGPGDLGFHFLNSPLAVIYTGTEGFSGLKGTASKWAILAETVSSLESSPTVASYNIANVTNEANAFVVTTSTANVGPSFLDSVQIDNPITNGDEDAVIFVTHNLNGGSGPYNHVVGVWYNTTTTRWYIFNEDNSAMPTNGLQFNVEAFAAPK